MKQSLTLIIGIMLLTFGLSAQTLEDAIRYSMRERMGTARGFGVGSSMAAIGGDFGSIASNPAGIAMFKRAEIQLSPAMFYGPTTSYLSFTNSGPMDADRSNFIIPSASYVSVNRLMDKHWTRTSFGIGVNRVMNYNRKFEFAGDQDHSITRLFIEQSDGINPDNLDAFSAGPAYDSYLTSYDTYTGLYSADIDANTSVRKSQVVDQKGGIDEITIAVGADYENKLQLGASLIIPLVRFKEKKQYVESLSGHPTFRRLEYDENLNSIGGGVAVKVGAKYIIAKKVHFGLAFHTPTWMRITEDYDTRAYYDYNFDSDIFPERGPKEAASPLGTFEYDFRSPWRALGGLGIIIGKTGFISTEVEFVDYNSAKFTIPDDLAYENNLNRQIDNNLGSTWALRVGGELRMDSFRFRGGFGMSENIYESESGFENSYFSLGFGVWIDRFFIDAGYRYQTVEQSYSPYTLSTGTSPIVTSDFSENNLILTFGVKL